MLLKNSVWSQLASPRQRIAFGFLVLGLALSPSGCSLLGKPKVKIDVTMAEVKPATWAESGFAPKQLVTVHVQVDKKGGKLADRVQLQAFVSDTPPPMADRASAGLAKFAAEARSDGLAVADANGEADIELDLARVGAGTKTLYVVGRMGTKGTAAGVASTTFEHKLEFLERTCSAGTCLSIIGTPTTISVQPPAFSTTSAPAFTIDVMKPGTPPVVVTLGGVPVGSKAKQDVWPIFGKMKVSEFTGRSKSIKLPLAAKLGEGPAIGTELSFDADRIKDTLFASLVSTLHSGKGVEIPGGSPTNKSRSLIFDGHRVGDDVPMADVDYVATDRSLRSTGTGRTCGPYSGGGKPITLTIEAQSFEVVVFERRTAKKVATKIFDGVIPDCPSSFMATSGANGASMKGELPDDGPIKAWLSTFIK
jgi:hypothetical protein